jgi:predicted transglutaminase-like cysteine proteinase
MALGAATPPPSGFVAFCRVQPDACGATAADLEAMDQAVRTAERASAVAAIRFDWSGVFGQTPPAPSSSPASAAGPAMTPQLWTRINRVNARVNRAIVRRTDADTYGRSEVWATPLASGAGFGDCEDYVLEKRRSLLAEGLPATALSIAVVITPRNERHAVLLVDTDAGEYVLDNLTPWVLPWNKTSYQWRERQVAGSAGRWASPAGAAQSLLLASLR